MNYSDLAGKLTARLAEQTDTVAADWHLVYRARYGMEVVFRVLKDLHGDGEVITQSFTCATAVNPIIAARLKPVYADITGAALSVDPSTIHCSDTTRALVMQHTLGLSADMVGARKACDAAGVLLIEDSAHRAGYIARDDAGMALADVSVHSFGAEKSLSTRFAGAIWVNPAMKNVALAQALHGALGALPALNPLTTTVARLYTPTNGVLNRLPQAVAKPLRSVLAGMGAFTPPIAPRELNAHQAARPALPAAWMVRHVLVALGELPAVEQQRQTAAEMYTTAARKSGTLTVPDGAQQAAPYVRFPVLLSSAAEADSMFAKLRAHGFYAGKWYRPTLFPGVVSQAAYGYDPTTCPVAEDISQRIINLPTNVSATTAQEIAHVVFG